MQRSPDEAARQVDVSFPRRLDEAVVTPVASVIAGVRETHEHRSEKWRKEEDSFLFHGFRDYTILHRTAFGLFKPDTLTPTYGPTCHHKLHTLYFTPSLTTYVLMSWP
jgi:hypothetical protein